MGISISRAGKLIIDVDGYVSANLDSLQVVDSADENGRERSQLEFIFKVPTTKGTSDKYLWTGLNVNSEKTYYPVDDDGVISTTPEYNKLTQLLIALGLLTEEKLNSDDELDIDIESLVGQEFQFKVKPNKLKPALSDIDIKSIRFKVAPQASKTIQITKDK
ncbi:hypothetical protein [Calothrix sp. FACHB-168]|uniref:hypothetical protein n=1 Tax=Calothrix sp. FACHB-168 TaxID=2692780 RepID=UPI001688355E|nr:hypothetical protein [Calothrix sp. FACHB-168]MBD2208116.1 hypothetical protein [Calothrix sp. FACHB-168]